MELAQFAPRRLGARAAAPIARTVLDYYLLGKLPVVVPKPGADGEDEETD